MKILHVISYCPLVGEAARVLALADAQREEGDDVAILTHPDSPLAHEARERGLPLVTAPLDRGFHLRRDIAALRRMRRHVETRGVEILHVHRSKEHWLGQFGRRVIRPAPALVRTRHVLLPPRRHLLSRWLYGDGTERVICVSEVVRSALAEALALPAERFPVVPGALPGPYFRPPPGGTVGELRARLRIPGDAAVLALVARCEPVKGQATAIDALAALRRERRPVVLVLAWNRTTEYRLELEERIRAAGLRDAVRWLGPQEDIRPLLHLAEIALVTSVGSEGWSRAALEAMAAARPVVASAVGSLPEIVRDGRTGMLVPPGDAEALAGALRPLLDDDARREAMGRSALEAARTYTTERLRKGVQAVYGEALAARKGRG
jgi:glycosyltransferase involved in cell wall biosynthesis